MNQEMWNIEVRMIDKSFSIFKATEEDVKAFTEGLRNSLKDRAWVCIHQEPDWMFFRSDQILRIEITKQPKLNTCATCANRRVSITNEWLCTKSHDCYRDKPCEHWRSWEDK